MGTRKKFLQTASRADRLREGVARLGEIRYDLHKFTKLHSPLAEIGLERDDSESKLEGLTLAKARDGDDADATML